jgi:hypothetical protein
LTRPACFASALGSPTSMSKLFKLFAAKKALDWYRGRGRRRR